MKENFLVVTVNEGVVSAEMKHYAHIIKDVSMFDCFEPDVYRVYEVMTDGSLREVTIHGTWHNAKDPLYIKGTSEDGKVLFSGYGEDH